MDSARTTGFVARCTEADTPAVAQVVNALFGDVGYVVTERVNDVQFRRLSQVNLTEELSAWDAGRVFSDAAEVRWRRTAQGRFAILLLTEDEHRIPVTWERLDKSWSVVEHHGADDWIRLWGERKEGSAHWVEVRIPRALVYPLTKKGGTVQLSWIEYRNDQGTPQLIRFKEIR